MRTVGDPPPVGGTGQAGQTPPQSISVSSPFFIPSEHEGAERVIKLLSSPKTELPELAFAPTNRKR